MASLDLDEELLKDKELITNIQNLDHSIVDIETLLESRISVDYTSLSTEDKIKHDLLIAFTLNSLYWMYLRLDGVDPTTHNIKRELDRVKTTMDMAKGAMAKKNMPRVDKRAAGRFVSQALWNPDEKKRRSDEIKRHLCTSNQRYGALSSILVSKFLPFSSPPPSPLVPAFDLTCVVVREKRRKIWQNHCLFLSGALKVLKELEHGARDRVT